jgi:hypothetical protein
MRVIVASLIVLSVLFFWDQSYNNGTLSDGLRSMGRSIAHSMTPYRRTEGLESSGCRASAQARNFGSGRSESLTGGFRALAGRATV